MNAEEEHQITSNSPADQALAGRGRETRPKVVQVHSLVGLFLWAVLLFLAFRFFYGVKFVLLGGMGAAVMAASLQPVADRMRGPTSLRALLTIFMLIAVLASLLFFSGWLMYEPIKHNIEQWPRIREGANEVLQSIVQRAGMAGEISLDDLGAIAGDVLTGGSISNLASDVAGGMLTIVLAVLVVVVGAAYLLARPAGNLPIQASKLLPQVRREPTCRAIADLQHQYRWWMIATLFSMVLIGTLFGLSYWIIGLKFALPLALIAGLAQVVPTFGPMIMLVLSLLIAATQGVTQVVGVGIIYVVLQTVESEFLTPMMMQKAVRIPPIVTLLTIILWGNVFGAPGLILAIPIDLTIWAFLHHHVVRHHELQVARGVP